MPTATAFDELSRLGPLVPLSRDSRPFDATDRLVGAYVRRVVRLFARARSRAQRESDAYALMLLFAETYSDAHAEYAACLAHAYGASYMARHGRVAARADRMPAPVLSRAQAASRAFLADYASPEGYVPDNEWERKRARCLESVVAAARDGRQIRAPVDAARNSAVRQVRQGADDMTDLAVLDAYRDAGVRRVELRTQRDGRVCATCLPLDGRRYLLDGAPTLPLHWNCRCFYVPAAD